MTYDTEMRLVNALHLHAEPDGGALVVDDRNFTAARVNKTAHIVLQALRAPRRHHELVTRLADATHHDASGLDAPVAQLVHELAALDWIECLPCPDRPS